MTNNAARIPTVVLYDIMREAATRVRGTLMALQDANPEAAADYRARRIALTERIDQVDVDDREAILRTTAELRAEDEQLNAA